MRHVLQHTRECFDEMADLRREARVQGRRQRAARSVEPRAQFVCASDGLRRQRTDDLPRAQLMSGIAHGEIPGDGERFDAVLVFAHRAPHRLFVEGARLLAGRRVSALDPHQCARAVTLEPRPLHHRIVEADEERADGTEAVFHDGIRRERGRDGHETDVFTTRTRRQQVEHGPDRLADADGEIPRRRECLGARDDPAAVGEQNRIGEGAAGVEAEPEIVRCIHPAILHGSRGMAGAASGSKLLVQHSIQQPSEAHARLAQLLRGHRGRIGDVRLGQVVVIGRAPFSAVGRTHTASPPTSFPWPKRRAHLSTTARASRPSSARAAAARSRLRSLPSARRIPCPNGGAAYSARFRVRSRSCDCRLGRDRRRRAAADANRRPGAAGTAARDAVPPRCSPCSRVPRRIPRFCRRRSPVRDRAMRGCRAANGVGRSTRDSSPDRPSRDPRNANCGSGGSARPSNGGRSRDTCPPRSLRVRCPSQ